jgi:hypothetical protein
VALSKAGVSPSGELLRPFESLDRVQEYEGSLVTTSEVPVGSFLQAEVMSPKLAGENVKAGLKALAHQGAEKEEAAAAKASSSAADTATGDGGGGAATAMAMAVDGVALARSSSRACSQRVARQLLDAEHAAGGGLLFSCLGRSSDWYESNGMAANFEPAAFAAAFPGKALAGFLANGEIFGEVNSPPRAAAAAAAAGGGQPTDADPEVAPAEEEELCTSLGGKSVKELKAMLRAAEVDFADCLEKADLVSRAFQSWKRSILTEIYLCHACSDHGIEGMETNARAGRPRAGERGGGELLAAAGAGGGGRQRGGGGGAGLHAWLHGCLRHLKPDPASLLLRACMPKTNDGLMRMCANIISRQSVIHFGDGYESFCVGAPGIQYSRVRDSLPFWALGHTALPISCLLSAHSRTSIGGTAVHGTVADSTSVQIHLCTAFLTTAEQIL